MHDRFYDVEVVLNRRGTATPAWFEAEANVDGEVMENIAGWPVLCVGAGGLGCEILKDLALTGFKNIHVIDMDTIDVTNLNRQFLFRMEDVGKTKSETAAKRVMERVSGCQVTAHVGRIEERDNEFYEEFAVIILGLDSLEARRYMNQVACSFLEFAPDGSVKQETIKPLVDGGTEGFKGHARVIFPGQSPCFDCTLWLFPPQITFPLCTLAETPRSPAHCVEYAHLILWGKHWGDVQFDSDNEKHMQWVYEEALKRAEEFDIAGVTLQVCQGVVKNIIPAIPSTNAIIAAACVFETLKIFSACYKNMDNYMMYNGTDGVYTHTVKYERDPNDPICSGGTAVSIQPDMSLKQLLDHLLTGELGELAAPSISAGGTLLYMRGPLEASYRKNLDKRLDELLAEMPTEDKCVMVVVTDRKLANPAKVRLVHGEVIMTSV